MKKATILLIGLLTAVYVFASGFESPQDLAKQFITNVNAKNKKALWNLLHPKCLDKLSGLERDFIDASIARSFRETIPEKCNIKVAKWEKEFLPYAKISDWPVKPTHTLDVEFTNSKGSIITIRRFIAKEKGRWFITVPIIHKTTLLKYADKKSKLYLLGGYFKRQQKGSLENITDYGKMLADELGIKHCNVRMNYEVPVYIAAHYSVEVEGEITKSRTVRLDKPYRIVGIYFVYRTSPLIPHTNEATHMFDVILRGYTKEKGEVKESQRKYLQERAETQHFYGRSTVTKSFLFNNETALPLERKASYCTLIDRDLKNEKDVKYSIRFEVSEDPIQKG